MGFKTDAQGTNIPNWGPSSAPILITKSDSTDLSTSGIRGVDVGGTGDVAIIGLNDTTTGGAGTDGTFSAVPAGTILPVIPKRVMATHTTATLLVGLA